MSYFSYSKDLPQWVGELPSNWQSDWMKWHITLSTKRPDEDQQSRLPYISNEDIESWTGVLLREELKPSESDSRLFSEGDVLLNKLRPYLAKVFHATFEGVSSGEFLCLRPSKKVEARFLFYVLVSKGFIDTIDSETFGAKMPRADWEIVGHQPLPLPPLETQRRIAAFLDEKTARIDGLIAKKRELLERLAEKRQALITHAVTKGLNPEAPVKPSGIDWIGDIPAHWEMKQLKYKASHNDEVLAESTDDLYEIDYIEISGVNLINGIETISQIAFFQAPSRARRKVRSGDTIISTVRTYLKAIAFIENASNSLIVSTGFCVVRPQKDVDPEYLGWALKSESFISEVVSRSVGVSYPAINASDLITIAIPFPPHNEQVEIRKALGSEAEKLDKQISLINTSIAFFAEYRSTLITAAVTGQIKEFE